jgi:hypothetical protein
MSDDKIEARKFRAGMVAEKNLAQRFDTIEWEETVLKPALAELKNDLLNGVKVKIELPELSRDVQD